MPRQQRWTKWLTGYDRVEVRIRTSGKEVLGFAVQYLAEMAGTWHAVVRFDTAHGGPHLDILTPGGIKETIRLEELDNRDALTYALTDISDRWEFYRARYQRSMKK